MDKFELSDQELAKYIEKMEKVFSVLISLYEKLESDVRLKEADIVQSVLKKLSFTIKTLILKYQYSQETRGNLTIDISDSGFINSYELQKMTGDITIASSKLDDFPQRNVLLDMYSEQLFKQHNRDEKLLAQISEHSYYSELVSNKEDLLYPFMLGDLKVISEGDMYEYSVWWSCFDSTENRPFIYMMDFESKIDFSEDQEALNDLMTTLKGEGNTAIALSAVGHNIDGMMKYVHPKLIKRIGFTVYSKSFSVTNPDFIEELLEFGEEGSQLCLLVDNETLFSHRQIESGNFLTKQLREVFYIPKQCREMQERGVSHLEKWLIMPYSMHQHANGTVPEDFNIYSFDKEGDIHGL